MTAIHSVGRLALASFLILLPARISSQTLPSPWSSGIATNYGGAQDGMDPSSPSFGTLEGSCGYGQLNPDVYPYWTVGALSPSNQFAIAGPSQGCGQCFEIQCVNDGGPFSGRCGSSQSITITITDSCPECEANHIDLQALTFNKIAPMAIGRIDIQYRRVDCTPPLPVSIDIDSNVGVGGWLRLVVEKTAGFGGVTSVDIRSSGAGTWQPMTNKFGSAWEVSNTPSLPWDFQFTSDSSQTVVANSLVMQNGQIGNIPTGVQFSLSGSTGGTSISFDSAPGSSPPAAGTAPPVIPATPPALPATPPIAASPPAGSPPSGCCTDVTPTVPDGSITCQQQKDYGKCTDAWMVSGNYCQLTCGNCPASCNGGAATPPAAGGLIAANGSPPPPTFGTPPAGLPPPAVTTPPTGVPTSSGSVETFSINASPPAVPASPPPGQSGGCTDVSPIPGQECSALANQDSCSNGSIGEGFCSQSCYRAPCAGR